VKRVLYDLAAADPSLRFSPYCWRIKLALAHKNLPFETVPWRFTDKDAIAFSGQELVPVLVDGGRVVADSQTIAEYLETVYPHEASLFGGAASRALTMFVKNWTETKLHSAIRDIVLPDIFQQIAPQDRAYFRTSREAYLGMSIETLGAQREQHLPALAAALAPLRRTLEGQKFVAGEAPHYADHIVFGALRWACLTSTTPLWAEDDVLAVWMRAVLATYGLV
jgi:glutathione S-transferase